MQDDEAGDEVEFVAGECGGDLLKRKYQRLELALVEAATATLNGSNLPAGSPLVSAETAIKLLTLRGSALPDERGKLPQLDPVQLRRAISARILAVRHVTALPAQPADHTE